MATTEWVLRKVVDTMPYEDSIVNCFARKPDSVVMSVAVSAGSLSSPTKEVNPIILTQMGETFTIFYDL